MKGKFFRRLRAGFTLAESLVAVAILALVSTAVVAVSSTILNTKNRMIELGKCQTLASTAIMTIAAEIRYGQNIHVEGDDGTVVLDSLNFGAGTQFFTDGSRIHEKNSGTGSGYPLLPEKYYGSLTVSHLKLEKVSDSGEEPGAASERAESRAGDAIKIYITVSGSGSNLYSTELTVPALNGIK